MAEDLLRLPNKGETLEEVGSKCFDDLASTFLFKELPDGDKYFVMHELFHDLAIFLAGDFYCTTFPNWKLRISGCTLEFPELHRQKHDLVELEIAFSSSSLTSFSLDVFPNLKNLQITVCENLESLSLSEPPHAALQHLEVSFCSNLEELPRDMNILFPNLESLCIRGCLKKLSVGKSEEQLRYLSSMVGNFKALTHIHTWRSVGFLIWRH
ncbi:hypothetical protein PIB30_069784 [Stylosanthes scabra]|uniref:Disease resistance protein winged helix domain-containing protein n=1 Tax=Stylosanthes scabra TaxID=79078 RepID=A0ABU6SQ74_9FABA|nr:hypothetical protein [Stylosanthes scabra]